MTNNFQIQAENAAKTMEIQIKKLDELVKQGKAKKISENEYALLNANGHETGWISIN